MAREGGRERGPALLGAAAAAAVLAMLGGVLVGLLAVMVGDYVGAGACLTAVGVTGGLVLNAYVRR
jgi:hypothetical protein